MEAAIITSQSYNFLVFGLKPITILVVNVRKMFNIINHIFSIDLISKRQILQLFDIFGSL